MSKFYLQHPEDDQLLAYSDGELRGLAATRVRRHLKDCWRCRTQMEDLQATVSGFMRYKERVLETHLPEPPSGWRNLKLEFERIDRTVPPPRFGDRMVARYGAPAIRVASVAAVLAVTGLGYVLVRQFSPSLPPAVVETARPSAPSAMVSPSLTPMPNPVSRGGAAPSRGVDAQETLRSGNAEVKVVAALHRE
jgi:anti-sigma factor RsiW